MITKKTPTQLTIGETIKREVAAKLSKDLEPIRAELKTLENRLAAVEALIEKDTVESLNSLAEMKAGVANAAFATNAKLKAAGFQFLDERERHRLN